MLGTGSFIIHALSILLLDPLLRSLSRVVSCSEPNKCQEGDKWPQDGETRLEQGPTITIKYLTHHNSVWLEEQKIVKKTWKCCWNLINNFNEDRCASGKNGKIDKHKKQTVFDYEQGWSYVC